MEFILGAKNKLTLLKRVLFLCLHSTPQHATPRQRGRLGQSDVLEVLGAILDSLKEELKHQVNYGVGIYQASW